MASPGIDRKICLVDRDGGDTECEENNTGLVAFSGLSMTEGDHLFRVGGDVSATDEYSVDLLVTGKVEAGRETQPNGSVTNANLLNESGAVTGAFGPGDGDRHVFHLHTEGDPQLWRVEVVGAGIAQLRSVDASDATLADGAVSPDGTYASLTDQFLTPGEHWFSVSGSTGQFSFTATPVGAPDPNGEREPNDNLANSEILRMGQVRTGRLDGANDVDVYRFNLAATDHVLIRAQSPADGKLRANLSWYGATVQTVDAAAAGEVDTMDLVLQAGDYSITLNPDAPGEQKYQLSIERADPFLLSVDQEPNNTFQTADPLPDDLSLSGNAGEFNDDDWYAIPSLAAASKLIMTYATTAVSGRIFDGAGNEIPVSISADGLGAEANLPANTPLGLKLSGRGAYAVGFTFTAGPAAVKPGKSTLTVTVSLQNDGVAAYWNQSQEIHGTVKLTNSGLLPQTVQLTPVTSHFAWAAQVSQSPVLVPPGSTGVSVPVTLAIQPDAWAGVPVRLTVRARTRNGAVATGFIEITPGRDAAPADPSLSWPVPAALLGGLDVASIALGAQVGGAVDRDREAELHDEFATSGGGFHAGDATYPVTLTVQLAGDGESPVAGIILNPLNDGSPSSWLRAFTLLLSSDGETYTEALRGELQPLPVDQSFVLPAPVMAKYAQLVMRSSYDPSGAASAVSLGEWKVIATPGFAPGAGSINVADLANGGHVVTMSPQFDAQTDAQAILTSDTASKTIDVEGGVKPSWTVGFWEERAANVSEMEWVDPDGTNADARFNSVTVEVSTDTPFGPWTRVGVWNLTRATDGRVAPYRFDGPVWARFVRFTGNGPKEGTNWEYPAQIKILELSTGMTYQSILGQWGYGNQNGPFERTVAPSVPPASSVQTNVTKETAVVLAPNSEASGRVQIGGKTAWYTVTAPPDRNTLTFTLRGDPIVDAVVHAFDASGVEIPVAREADSTATAALYVASVTPGKTYSVEVVQPIHSIVFAFDTSLSMANYEPMVRQALEAFAADVTPGQEYVNVMPFSEAFLLKEWSDQPYEIQSALSAYTDASLSSSSEETMLAASQAMAVRDGSKAILLVTDGETSSYDKTSALWPALAAVGPRIFAVHVGSGGDGGASRHSMQDWADSTDGSYQYTVTQGEMDRAFDRLATMMRRPAGFTLSYAATNEPTAPPSSSRSPAATPVDREPGSLQITMAAAAAGAQPAALSTDIAVEIILDTSGSMLQEIEPGKTRIDVARSTLVDLVTNKLPAGVPVALRTFADDPGSCDTVLRSPLGSLDSGSMASTIEGIGVTNLVKTPIGAALDQVQSDLSGVAGQKIVLLVTDGEETCGGDPAESISRLAARGFDVQVNIVGFALDDDALKATFKKWATLGNGSYFDATDSEELNVAVDKALAPPFQVFDANGVQIGAGRVGGNQMSLPAGTYRVVVLSEPKRTFETVMISSGKKTTLNLEDGDTG